MSELFRREHIRAHAEAAARDRKGPDTCPYDEGTDPEQYWKDVFYTETGRIMNREEA